MVYRSKRMNRIKVFGHKSPDTDSIVSAIVFAWYLTNVKNQNAKPYRLGEINKETQYVLNRFGVPTPRLLSKVKDGDKIVIVDTNNPRELIDISNAQVLEVLDHHKLTGGLNYSLEPFNVTIRRTAAAATVVYLRMRGRGVRIYPREIAGLLLAGIISDSVNFTSPVTTDTDIKIGKRLAEEYNFDTDELADQMFEHKSQLGRLPTRKIVLCDSKMYDLRGKRIRVSIIETTKPDLVYRRENDLKQELAKIKQQESLDEIYLFVFDINEENAVLIAPDTETEQEVQKRFKTEIKKGRIVLPGIMSRKKQVIPKLS